MNARWLHDQGDCWMGCQFCRWEDERDAAETNEGDNDDE